MARPPFTFERNALRSNGSFALRFIASPPFAGLILKRRPFYSIAPRRDNPLAAAPHTLARERLARLSVTYLVLRCGRFVRWRQGEQFCSVTVIDGAYITHLASVRAAQKRRHTEFS